MTRITIALLIAAAAGVMTGPSYAQKPTRPSTLRQAQGRPEPSRGATDTPGVPGKVEGGNPRLFAPQDLGLLEPPDREAWQKPDQVMDALHVAEGTTVADLGAGGGWFTMRLARRVGRHGRVYAVDVQRLMIEAIRRRVEREGLTGIVTTVLGEHADPRLPSNALDAVVIVDAFHETQDPVRLLRNVSRSLRPQGRIGIIEYREGDGGPGPDASQRVPPSVVISQAAAAGLKLIEPHKFLPYQYFLIFGK
jgi:SAM-dependent methyltransferase